MEISKNAKKKKAMTSSHDRRNNSPQVTTRVLYLLLIITQISVYGKESPKESKLASPTLASPAGFPPSAEPTEETRRSKEKKVKRGAEALKDPEVGSALDPHPDPNDENYEGMIYVGRMDEEGRRIGFDVDNGELRKKL